jgi:hypothetical protein
MIVVYSKPTMRPSANSPVTCERRELMELSMGRWGDLHRNGWCTVLVVHEAQLAGPMLLEEIRLGDVGDDQ